MIQFLASLKVPGSILRIEVVDDFIYILDNKFTLVIYSNNDFTLQNSYTLLSSQEDKHIYENTVAISKNLDFYHSYTNKTSGVLFRIKLDKIRQTPNIELNKRAVSFAKFSNNSKTLLIGGEDGRSCFYDLESQRSFFSLEARSDFISSASFSKNDKLVCIGGYDKAIKIHDIEKHKLLAEVDLSDTPEDIIFLEDESGVVGITRDKKLFYYLLKEKRLQYANMLFAEWPTSITKIGLNHVLVGTKGDLLYILNLNELQLVKRLTIDNFGAKSLKVDNDKLYIGYSNGKLKIIDLNHRYEEYKSALQSNKFAKATNLIRENIFLITKEISKKYDNVWEQVLDMAKDALLTQEVEKAHRIVKPFLWDKRKKDQFNALQINLKDIKHFEKLVEEKKYVLAYKFSDEKAFLQTQKTYQELEDAFHKQFQVAKTLFMKDTDEDIQRAKNIITPYIKITSKKDLIQSLILNYKIFVRSFKLIKARNFKVYFRLVKNNEFLQEEKLYEKVYEIGKQTYNKLLELEQKGDFQEASKLAYTLEDFIPFHHVLDEVKQSIHSKQELEKLIKEDDIHSIYNKIAYSTELELCPLFTEYHKKFELKKEEATVFANQGKSPQVKETLQDHINIEYLINSIAIIFKLSYLVEIELAMQNSPEHVNISATLQRYALLFGIDDELYLLAKKSNFYHLVPNYPPNPTGYYSNNFYANIVVSA